MVDPELEALAGVRARHQINRKTPPSPAQPPRPKKRRWGKRVVMGVVIAVLVVAGAFSYRLLAASNKISTTERSILGQLSDLLFSSNKQLKGEKDDRINILLLAVGGEGHSGEELADTIMMLSIRPSDKSVGILSIPRDLYVQVPGENYSTKINAVHAYGEAKKKDGGPALLEQKVTELTGQPIDYFGRVDFTAFKGIVDAVGGVDVTIPNSFYDYWHKISFPAGTEKMDGDRALAYVRARYVEGPEGGDFKRAARQQQLLLALRDKVFSVQTALDFNKINSIIDSLSSNIRTDMQLWEMNRFYEIARQIDHSKVHTNVLTTGPKGVLVGSTEILGGVPASILKTRTGDYSEIQSIAKNIFTEGNTPAINSEATPAPTTPDGSAPPSQASTSPTPTPSSSTSPSPSAVSVEVRNGTNTAGLAAKTKTKLEGKGYTVTGTGNAVNRSTEKTTVYALNLTQADAASDISALLNAASDTGLPSGEAKSSAAILVILGSDAAAE